MIINSVRLKNFRSHENTKIDFGPGINVILGENGAGKTSILEALSFSMFKDYSGNIDTLVRSGQKTMSVEVVFTSHGRMYRIVRSRSKNSTDSKMYQISDGNELELRAGDSGVDEEMSSILGIDRYLFTNAVYVRQGEIARLLTEKPANRKQLIGRLLGIDALEKVWERMRAVLDVYREKKNMLEGELGREDELLDKKKETAGHIEEVKLRIEKTLKTIDGANNELARAQAEEKRFSEFENKFSELSGSFKSLLSNLERENERYEESIDKIRETEEAKKDLDSIRKRLVPGWEQGLNKKITGGQKQLSMINETLGTLRGRMLEMTELSRRLESAGEKCPLCGCKLTYQHRTTILNDKHAKIRDAQAKDGKLAKEKDKLSREIDFYQMQKEEMSSFERKRIELEGIVKRGEEIKMYAMQAESLIKDLEHKKSALEKEMNALTEKRKKFEESKKRLDELRSEISALREASGRQEGKLQELENIQKNIEKEAIKLQDKRAMHKKITDFMGTLNEIRKLFDKSGLQQELRKRAVPLIQEHMQEFFRHFNFDYSDLTLDENYVVTLYGPGGESTTEMMSGGEQIAAALAMRLGIARTLAGSSAESVFLDEPTIFLDEQRRQDLISVLKILATIPQLIVVTHDVALEEAADKICIIRKSKGVSSVENN